MLLLHSTGSPRYETLTEGSYWYYKLPKDDHSKYLKEDPSHISPIVVQSNSPQSKDGTVLVSVFAGVAWAL